MNLFKAPTLRLMWALDSVDRGEKLSQSMAMSVASGYNSTLIGTTEKGEHYVTEEGREFLEIARKWYPTVFEYRKRSDKDFQAEASVSEVLSVGRAVKDAEEEV